MDRRAKVELFEEIRREYEFGVGTIKGVARKLGVHRRMVRQALANALPPERKRPERDSPKLAMVKEFIDGVLEADRKVHRKQRHTAHRIYKRIEQEMPEREISEASVRRYVAERKIALGLTGREVFIAQSYQWGEEAQVDWYEAYVDFGADREKVQFFSMRSMASGGAFHRAYPRANQQSFFEAHELAFHYFGGVFRHLKYDNLKAAVKKIFRGQNREQGERFIAFRSHWQFDAQFCRPGKEGAHEKGGVEGEAGYFRRNHLVPIPQAENFADLNRQLLAACRADEQRLIADRAQNVGQGMIIEREYLLPMASTGFDLIEVSFPRVDSQGRVRVRNNYYSTPLRPGLRVEVKVLPANIEVWQQGRVVASHERAFGNGKEILNLEHYLDALERKPGALPGSKPLAQWRAQGKWPESFDRLWQALQQRLGKQPGTKAMIELLQLGRQQGWEQLKIAVEKALAHGCSDIAAIKYLMVANLLEHKVAERLDVGVLSQYERPLPAVNNYDQLREVAK
jgi:transposase